MQQSTCKFIGAHAKIYLQIAVAAPGEHPLQYVYTMWYSRRTPGKQTSSQNYDQNLKKVGTFASVCVSSSFFSCWCVTCYAPQIKYNSFECSYQIDSKG